MVSFFWIFRIFNMRGITGLGHDSIERSVFHRILPHSPSIVVMASNPAKQVSSSYPYDGMSVRTLSFYLRWPNWRLHRNTGVPMAQNIKLNLDCSVQYSKLCSPQKRQCDGNLSVPFRTSWHDRAKVGSRPMLMVGRGRQSFGVEEQLLHCYYWAIRYRSWRTISWRKSQLSGDTSSSKITFQIQISRSEWLICIWDWLEI